MRQITQLGRRYFLLSAFSFAATIPASGSNGASKDPVTGEMTTIAPDGPDAIQPQTPLSAEERERLLIRQQEREERMASEAQARANRAQRHHKNRKHR